MAFFDHRTELAHGWWRFEWFVQHAPRHVGEPWHLPSPWTADLVRHKGPGFVVGLFEDSSEQTRVELLSRYPQMDPLEIAYVSLVLQEAQDRVGPIRIDGRSKHTILMAAYRGDPNDLS